MEKNSRTEMLPGKRDFYRCCKAWRSATYTRDLAKASKGVAKNPFFGKFYLMWSKECVKTTTML